METFPPQSPNATELQNLTPIPTIKSLQPLILAASTITGLALGVLFGMVMWKLWIKKFRRQWLCLDDGGELGTIKREIISEAPEEPVQPVQTSYDNYGMPM